jgi:hypothetical protein
MYDNAKCPRCNTCSLKWFDEADCITIDGKDYWKMCCDLEEALCTKCKIQLPYCPICTYLTSDDDHGDLAINYIRPDYPKRPEPLKGDLYFLTFIGCEGDTCNGQITKCTSADMQSKTDMTIPYMIDNFKPGFDSKDVPEDMIVVGPDGGAATYWWCPKCDLVQCHTDK